MAEWIIYQNLCKVFTYRDAEGVHNHNLSEIDLTKQLNQHNVVIIRGRRIKHAFKPDTTMFILFARASSDIPTSKPKFDRVVKSLELGAKDKGYCEVLFAFAGGISIHVQKQLGAGLKYAHPNVYFEVASHDIFALEGPKHVLVGAHRILSPAEKEYYKRTTYQRLESLARISPEDPMSFWYGIRPGDVVEIRTASETAGEVVRLRYCA